MAILEVRDKATGIRRPQRDKRKSRNQVEQRQFLLFRRGRGAVLRGLDAGIHEEEALHDSAGGKQRFCDLGREGGRKTKGGMRTSSGPMKAFLKCKKFQI
jgi:hypothetical protein